MTFPIDFPDHPKVKPLSALAKWTFVEMNAYSRRLGLDGRIPAVTAHAMWAKRPLADLVASHAERPLVVLESDTYVIRDYADHQMTTSDIEDLREKRAAAGAKGGRAKADRNQTGGNAVASARASVKPIEAESESESRSEIDLTDTTHLSKSLTLGAKRVRVHDFKGVFDVLVATCGPLRTSEAVELVEVITARAKGPVKDVDAYVAAACRNTPDEVRYHYERLDMGQVAS